MSAPLISGRESGLIFAWDQPGHGGTAIIAGFLLASLVLHAFCFYVFQIIYPPAVALLPPPGRVNLIAPNSEEGRLLLRWLEAEDPALASTTQPLAKAPALPDVHHAPSYLTRPPTLKEVLPPASDLGVPSAQPPAPVKQPLPQSQTVAKTLPTVVRFSQEFEAQGPTRTAEMKFIASCYEPPSAARFRLAINENGEVRYCFLQTSSGDTALDEQARKYLALARFSPIRNQKSEIRNDFIWGTATIEWGNDIAMPAPASTGNVAP